MNADYPNYWMKTMTMKWEKHFHIFFSWEELLTSYIREHRKNGNIEKESGELKAKS